MSFLGLDPGDPNNWYQSPQLGLFSVSPAGYGDGIPGSYCSTHASHPPPPSQFPLPPRYPPPLSQFSFQPSYPPPPPPSQTIINGYVFPQQFPFPNPTDRSTSQPIYAQSQSMVEPIYPDYRSFQPASNMNPLIPIFQSPPVPTFLPQTGMFLNPFPSLGVRSSNGPTTTTAAPTPSLGSTQSHPMFGSTPSQSEFGSSSSTQPSGANSSPFGPTVSVAISGSAMFGSSSSPPPISDVLEQNEVLHSRPAVSVMVDELEKLRQPLSVALTEEVNRTSPVLDENFTNVQLLQELTDEDTVDENDEPAPILVDAVVDNKVPESAIYRQSPPQIGGAYWMSLRSVVIPASGIRAPLECHSLSVVRIDECLSSLDFALIVEKNENFSSRRPAMNSVHCLETIEDARELFLKMPERNIVSWKTLISTLVLNGQEEKALDVSNAMILEGMVPTHFTLAILFSVCERWLDVEKVRKCHSLGMGGLKQMDKIAEALEMFKLMCRRGVSIHSASSFVDIEKDPSSVALTLLKAIIKLKLVVSEMYDPLIRVAELMVTRQQRLWGAAAQALGLLVEIKVMKKGFHKHFNSVLQVTENTLQSAIDAVTHGSLHEIAIPFWKEVFYSLVMLKKFLNQFHELGFDRNLKNIWEAISAYLCRQIKTRLVGDAANKLITQNMAFIVCSVHFLIGQTECADSLSRMLGVCEKGCSEFGVNEHGCGSDDKENDVKRPDFNEKLDIFQSSHLSGGIVVSSDDSAGNLLPNDTFGIMVRNAKLFHEYVNVLANILFRSVSKERVSSNVRIMDTIVAALCGKGIDSIELHVKMDGVGISFLFWLLPFPNTKFKREAASIIPSLAYPIDDQLVGWNAIHALMYTDGFIFEFLEKPKDRKLAALTDTATKLRIDDLSNQETPYLAIVDIYVLYRKMMFLMLQAKFQKAHDFGIVAQVECKVDVLKILHFFFAPVVNITSQEASGAIEAYHVELKVKLFADSHFGAFQRVDSLVHKLITELHSRYWLDQYADKCDSFQNINEEGIASKSWHRALQISDSAVTLDDKGRLFAKVSSQKNSNIIHLVWIPGSELSFCDYVWSMQGNICKHATKVYMICEGHQGWPHALITTAVSEISEISRLVISTISEKTCNPHVSSGQLSFGGLVNEYEEKFEVITASGILQSLDRWDWNKLHIAANAIVGVDYFLQAATLKELNQVVDLKYMVVSGPTTQGQMLHDKVIEFFSQLNHANARTPLSNYGNGEIKRLVQFNVALHYIDTTTVGMLNTSAAAWLHLFLHLLTNGEANLIVVTWLSKLQAHSECSTVNVDVVKVSHSLEDKAYVLRATQMTNLEEKDDLFPYFLHWGITLIIFYFEFVSTISIYGYFLFLGAAFDNMMAIQLVSILDYALGTSLHAFDRYWDKIFSLLAISTVLDSQMSKIIFGDIDDEAGTSFGSFDFVEASPHKCV